MFVPEKVINNDIILPEKNRINFLYSGAKIGLGLGMTLLLGQTLLESFLNEKSTRVKKKFLHWTAKKKFLGVLVLSGLGALLGDISGKFYRLIKNNKKKVIENT